MSVAPTPTATPHSYLQRQARWHPVEIAFWLATLLPFFLFPNYLVLASQIAITALFALSLDLILGYAGIVSLGHAAFFGLGAYTAGLFSKFVWGEPISGLILGGLVAGIVGYAASFIIARFRHLALIMITLGMGLLLHEAANSASWLTGGADGLQGVKIWPIFNTFRFDLWGYTAYSYSLVVLFLVFLVTRRIINSPFGLSLRGIRENSVRMPALGAPSHAHIRKIYTISAVIAGLAGALLAQTTETVSLELIGFQRSADVLVILILGGAGTLYGGLVGAIIFMVARDQFSGTTPQFWYFWIGMLLIAVVMSALFALSLDLILGYAGIVSLGHAAFFGLGAYAAGCSPSSSGASRSPASCSAGSVAGIVGYAASFIIARFRHLALIMITLGIGLLLHEAANSASWLTGGADGLQGVNIWPLFGIFRFDLYGYTAYIYSLVVLFLVLPGRAADHQFAVRAFAARHPRKFVAHAGARRAEPRAHPQDLHHLGRDGRHRRRAAGADHRDRLARSARLPALRRRAGDADPRRRRPALWRARRRDHLHGGARPVLRHQRRNSGISGSACC